MLSIRPSPMPYFGDWGAWLKFWDDGMGPVRPVPHIQGHDKTKHTPACLLIYL